MSAEEQQQVQKLRATDQKVRAHEQAHLAAAAGLANGGANFQTVRGPDGKEYAVAGEVSIDVSPGQTPEQTIEKARRIQAAALAPADPSAQDRSVAAAAAQMQLRAQMEVSQQKAAEANGETGVTRGTGSLARNAPAKADEKGSDPLRTDARTRDAALSAYTRQEPAPASVFSVFA